jgi:hypothetical protein
MDKIKPILAVLKQRHFWVLCGVVLILSLVSWSSGKSYFSAEYTKQKGSLSSKFSALQTISSTPNHPNQSFSDQATVIATDLKQKTYAAWEQVYNAQKSELGWIEDPQNLGELPPEGDLPKPTLNIFRYYYSQNYIPQLFSQQVINLVRPVLVAEGAEPRTTGVIHWDQSQRDAIKNRYAWKAVPTSKGVRLAQEDYWIYRAVLQTINAANAGATETYEAAVKQIRKLEITQEALASLADMNVEIDGITSEMIVKEVTESPKVPSVDAKDEELDLGRYATPAVSADAGGEGGEGAGTGSAQYKLVPVRMVLLVRESRVPDLLAACANAKLPIEVRQCLVRQPEAAKQGAAAPAPGGAARPAAPAAGDAGGQTSIVDSGDVEIDLYGVIYLYNPPSRTALGLPAEEGAATEEAAAEEGI